MDRARLEEVGKLCCCEVMIQGYRAVLWWDSRVTMQMWKLLEICFLLTVGVQGSLGAFVLPQRQHCSMYLHDASWMLRKGRHRDEKDQDGRGRSP